MMKPGIDIRELAPTEKGLIRKIAQWYYEEWETPIDHTIMQLENQPGDNVLFHLVMTKDEELLATGGVYNHPNILKFYPSLSRFGPWVCLVYTAKDHRRQGLGEMLLTHLEMNARSRGFHTLYLYTFTAERLYKRCGWGVIDEVSYKGHETVIMKKEV